MKAFPEFQEREEPDYSNTRARACLYTLSPGMAGPFMRERDYLTTQHAYCGAQQLVRLAWESAVPAPGRINALVPNLVLSGWALQATLVRTRQLKIWNLFYVNLWAKNFIDTGPEPLAVKRQIAAIRESIFLDDLSGFNGVAFDALRKSERLELQAVGFDSLALDPGRETKYSKTFTHNLRERLYAILDNGGTIQNPDYKMKPNSIAEAVNLVLAATHMGIRHRNYIDAAFKDHAVPFRVMWAALVEELADCTSKRCMVRHYECALALLCLATATDVPIFNSFGQTSMDKKKDDDDDEPVMVDANGNPMKPANVNIRDKLKILMTRVATVGVGLVGRAANATDTWARIADVREALVGWREADEEAKDMDGRTDFHLLSIASGLLSLVAFLNLEAPNAVDTKEIHMRNNRKANISQLIRLDTELQEEPQEQDLEWQNEPQEQKKDAIDLTGDGDDDDPKFDHSKLEEDMACLFIEDAGDAVASGDDDSQNAAPMETGERKKSPSPDKSSEPRSLLFPSLSLFKSDSDEGESRERKAKSNKRKAEDDEADDESNKRPRVDTESIPVDVLELHLTPSPEPEPVFMTEAEQQEAQAQLAGGHGQGVDEEEEEQVVEFEESPDFVPVPNPNPPPPPELALAANGDSDGFVDLAAPERKRETSVDIFLPDDTQVPMESNKDKKESDEGDDNDNESDEGDDKERKQKIDDSEWHTAPMRSGSLLPAPVPRPPEPEENRKMGEFGWEGEKKADNEDSAIEGDGEGDGEGDDGSSKKMDDDAAVVAAVEDDEQQEEDKGTAVAEEGDEGNGDPVPAEEKMDDDDAAAAVGDEGDANAPAEEEGDEGDSGERKMDTGKDEKVSKKKAKTQEVVLPASLDVNLSRKRVTIASEQAHEIIRVSELASFCNTMAHEKKGRHYRQMFRVWRDPPDGDHTTVIADVPAQWKPDNQDLGKIMAADAMQCILHRLLLRYKRTLPAGTTMISESQFLAWLQANYAGSVENKKEPVNVLLDQDDDNPAEYCLGEQSNSGDSMPPHLLRCIHIAGTPNDQLECLHGPSGLLALALVWLDDSRGKTLIHWQDPRAKDKIEAKKGRVIYFSRMTHPKTGEYEQGPYKNPTSGTDKKKA